MNFHIGYIFNKICNTNGINMLKNSRLERPGELVEMSSVEESMKQESYDF